ncbi:GntR family transcriptional regulator [Marinobacter sp.]|uniref:GntR family transcriptional regulator n=1 Tax=Marinobacter sp. TaxID=50741 RepID=UPI0035667D04
MKAKAVATESASRQSSLSPASQALGAKRVLTSEQCYQKIRQAILEHRLTPGTRLVEERLVALSGLSRTKIRPVLARLAHEKLVDLIPNRGAFIASPSVKEAREVFFTRHLIEPAIVTLLCENAKSRDITKLKRHVAKEAQARLDNDRVAIIRLSGEFHTLLAELAGNAILARMMYDLTAQTCLVITLYDRPNIPACQHHHHGDIIQAIEAGDVELAKQRLVSHLQEVESSLNLVIGGEKEVDLSAIFA